MHPCLQIFDFYAVDHAEHRHEHLMHYKDFWRFIGDFRFRELFHIGTTDLVLLSLTQTHKHTDPIYLTHLPSHTV